MRTVLTLLALLLVPHGGTIAPPPPPPAPPPPPDPRVAGVQGATTPGVGPAPTTAGGPRTGGPSIGGPSAGAPRGPTTGRRAHTESLDRWEFWWEANQDELLLAHARRAVVSAAGQASSNGDAPTVHALTAEQARSRVLPALLSALGDKEGEVADTAALALARDVPAEQGALAQGPLVRVLKHDAKSAREAATLALGVVGSSDALPTLRALLLDEEEGRRASAHSDGVEEQVRAFAAAAIGAIGDASAFDDLRRVVEDPAKLGHSRSVAQLALLACGMLHGREQEIATFLNATAARRDLDSIVRAQAPIALAKLAASKSGEAAARASLPTLVALLAGRDADRSAAGSKESDLDLRRSAAVALGKLGARDLQPAPNGPQRAIETFLLQELGAPRHSTDRPFAALALGLWGRNERLISTARSHAVGALMDQFDKCTNPSYRGAIALSLGLLQAREATPPIAAAFGRATDGELAGQLALALGMLDAREQIGALRAELADVRADPRRETAIALALGLLGDPQTVPSLVERLGRARTFAEVATVARALGRIGDATAVDPLLALLADESAPPARRAVAEAALGLLAAKSDLPWNSAFKAGTNYCCRSEALAEIADLL
jgi:HEAT repeat protein